MFLLGDIFTFIEKGIFLLRTAKVFIPKGQVSHTTYLFFSLRCLNCYVVPEFHSAISFIPFLSCPVSHNNI